MSPETFNLAQFQEQHKEVQLNPEQQAKLDELKKELQVLIDGELSEETDKQFKEIVAKIVEVYDFNKGEFFEKLNLEEQYREQIVALGAVGILKKLHFGRFGFEENGQEYPIPTIEQVKAHLTESPEFVEFLKRKIPQGFKRIRVTPFAMNLEKMINIVNGSVVAQGGGNVLQSRHWQHRLSELWYFTQLSNTGKFIGGKSKSEILAHPENYPFLLNGYLISIVEEGDDIPLKTDSPKPLAGRIRIEPGETELDYLKKFSDPNSEYFGESPSITPEEWFCLFAEALYQKYIFPNKRIEDERSNIFDSESENWFISCLSLFGGLLMSHWTPDRNYLELGNSNLTIARMSSTRLAPRPALRRKN